MNLFRLITVLFISFFVFISINDSFATTSNMNSPSGYFLHSEEMNRKRSSSDDQADILLIQSSLPWGLDSNEIIIENLNYRYYQINMNEINNVNMDDYQVILIVNDQEQSFYDYYKSNYDFFVNYVRSGGVLLFFACDNGWAEGELKETLPGGILTESEFECSNIIINNDHPIVSGVLTNNSLALTNTDLNDNTCSHAYFSNVEEKINDQSIFNVDIIFKGSDSNMPTLIEYSLGNGKVIASTNAWEWAYKKAGLSGGDCGGIIGDYALKSLDDIYKYAFSVSGSHKVQGVKLSIYPDDNKLPNRPVLYKSKADLIDIIISIENTTGEDQNEISLDLKLNKDEIDENYLYIYRRQSPEDIAISHPLQLSTSDYTKSIMDDYINISLNNLQIMKKGYFDYLRPKNDQFVFRLKLSNNLNYGKEILSDTVAKIYGNNIKTSTVKLSDEGKILVAPRFNKIIVTNRELLYRSYLNLLGVINIVNLSSVNIFFERLYEIASEKHAVIYFIDKYDRDKDSDRLNNITINWLTDRNNLANGTLNANYTYGYSPTTNDDTESINDTNNLNDNQEEETRINQVALKIKSFIKSFIDNSGGINYPRYITILGGDQIIPFYRIFDESNTVSKYKQYHDATPVTKIDALNNYLFTDIIYRDYDNAGWRNGEVELKLGRVLGVTVDDITNLLSTSNKVSYSSLNAVKLENNMRNCELTNYDNSLVSSGYSCITKIDNVVIDVPNPGGCFPNKECGANDSAVWSDVQKLFSGTANNVKNFDIMRLMCHGSIEAVSSSEDFTNSAIRFCPIRYHHEYFSGQNLDDNRNSIKKHFAKFNPFFIFDACLVGIIDGYSSDHLLNSLLPLSIRGAFAASGVTWTPRISDYIDLFTNEFIEGRNSGSSLYLANRRYGAISNSTKDRYTIYQMNLFGVPWSSIQPPDQRTTSKKRKALKISHLDKFSSKINKRNANTLTKSVDVNLTNYSIDEKQQFDIIVIDGCNLLQKDENTPVLPFFRYIVKVPADTTINNVNVTKENQVSLGQLNIPSYQPPPPIPLPSEEQPSGFIEYPILKGGYPTNHFTYTSVLLENYQEIIITVIPVFYNFESKETTLSDKLTIDIEYSTPIKGILKSVSITQPIFSSNEIIPVDVQIENISSEDHFFNITLEILTLSETLVSNQIISREILKNSSKEINISIPAPDTCDSYRLMTKVDDGSVVIGQEVYDINVSSGKIVNFSTEEIINSDNYASFELRFNNNSDNEITIYQDIFIYNSQNELISSLPQVVDSIDSGETQTITTQWFPPNDVMDGVYHAYCVVKVDDEIFRHPSNNFRIKNINNLPKADASKDQEVDEEDSVLLDGSASSVPNGISFCQWIQTAGIPVELSDPQQISTTFIAPDITLKDLTLEFQLKITDKNGEISTDSCTIFVKWINKQPTAHAKCPSNAKIGDIVMLDGTESNDPDGFEDIVLFKWKQTKGNTVSLSDNQSITPTFTIPETDDNTVLSFQLTVSDYNGLTDTHSCSLSVINKQDSLDEDSSSSCFINSLLRY